MFPAVRLSCVLVLLAGCAGRPPGDSPASTTSSGSVGAVSTTSGDSTGGATTGTSGAVGRTLVRTGQQSVAAFAGALPEEPWIDGLKLLVHDATPGSASDLVTFFWLSGILVPYVSQDGGSNWAYVGPGTAWGSALPQALAQDASGRVHLLAVNNAAGSLDYSRVALAHDGAGHVSGMTVEVSGTAMSADVQTSGDVRAELVVGNDLAGEPMLFLAVMDDLVSGNRDRLRIGRTSSAAGLAPRQGHPEDWTDLDGNPGATTLVASNDAAFDAYSNHNMAIGLAQHPASRDLYLFAGTRETQDGTDPTPGIRRWRFAPSGGAAWAVSGDAEFLATDGAYPSTWGACLASENWVWFTLIDANLGLRIGRIDASGVTTADAVPSPDPVANMNGWASLSIDASETRVWAIWLRRVVTDAVFDYRTWSGYFDGADWDAVDETGASGYVDPYGMAGTVGWRQGLAVIIPADFPRIQDPHRPYLHVVRTDP